MRKVLIALVAIVLLLPNMCWGWGREGHAVIAAVAEEHLDETTKVMVQSLIGNNHLYSVAPWADDIRKERRESGTWHYVNIPLSGKYDSSRDCALPKSCVVAKVEDFLHVLMDKNAPREERAAALKYVVHFVADVHQPMHAVKEDAGGNGIHVSFLNSSQCGPYECNLHGVWDTSMILRTGIEREEYAQHEEQLVRAEKLDMLSGGAPEQWANESVALATAAWVPDGTNLDEKYYEKQIKVVDRQIALAGLRLARLLNETIGKMAPKDFARPNASRTVASTSAASQGTEASIKVWVNSNSAVYHCPSTQWYGNTKRGEYMTQAEAQQKGYRPIGGRICK